MLNILEEERRKSGDAFVCENCGLALDLNQSLHFCVTPENVGTPKGVTMNKEKKVEVVTQKNEVPDEDGRMHCTLCHARWARTPEYHTCKYAVDINDIEYDEDGMATCTLCKFQWNGFAQHICDRWFTIDINDIEYGDDEMATCTRCKFQWDGCAQHTCDW